MTQDVTLRAPDERALLEHLDSARFQAGVDAGQWRLFTCMEHEVCGRIPAIAWPFVLIAVSAAPRLQAPVEFLLRFELSDYPHAAPSASPWDCTTNTLLEANRRPRGDRVGLIFRTDWEGGRALYAPYDRIAATHWPRDRYPQYAWHSRRDLTFFLDNVFELLNDDDYVGV